MIEILVAMVLLGAISGIAFSAFSSSTKISNPYRNVALGMARSYLDSFYEYVRADQSASSGLPLSVTGAALPASLPPSQNYYGKTFTVTHVVNPNAGGVGTGLPIDANGDGRQDFRRVKMTVSW